VAAVDNLVDYDCDGVQLAPVYTFAGIWNPSSSQRFLPDLRHRGEISMRKFSILATAAMFAAATVPAQAQDTTDTTTIAPATADDDDGGDEGLWGLLGLLGLAGLLGRKRDDRARNH
jgi:MYXO-CTERM domain-containing protein